jgi:AcrR family transcriptional regulator
LGSQHLNCFDPNIFWIPSEASPDQNDVFGHFGGVTRLHETAIKILDAAQKLFNTRGLRKTTVEDIARDAGIGKGTIYNYFEDKEAIFLASKRAECAGLMQKFRKSIRGEQSACKQLVRFVKSWHHEVSAHHQKYPMSPDVFTEFGEVKEYAVIMREFHHDQKVFLTGIMETGFDTGEFQIQDIDMACWTVLVALNGLSMSHLLQEFEVTQSEKAEVIGNILVAAFSKAA